MKKLFAILVMAALAIYVYAQSPQKMSYQCVVRNSAGALVPNQAVGIKISILKGSATGTVVFSETYSPNPQTNANGLVTVEIGGGTASVGTFAGIDWSAGPYFLKTETDPAGGTSYTITGTSQLLSVPYALYAKTAANGFSGSYNDLTNKPVLFDGTWTSLTGKPSFATVATSGSYNDLLNRPTLFSGSYNDLTNKPVLFDGTWTSLTGKPVLFDGTWTSLSGKPAGFADGIDNVDDADNSITNEIQALSLSGTVLSLSNGGGSVTLPSSGGGDNWGTQTVVTNTTLTGAGTTANPLAVANTVITPTWANVQSKPAGFADGIDNVDDADNSITNEIQALSLSGTVLSLSNGGGSVTLPSSGGGDNWGTQAVVTDATLAGNGTTATPLRIADNGVTTVKLAGTAVTAEKLAASSVTSDKISAGAVTGAKIAQAGATNGQVLKWNSTTWAPDKDLQGGLTLPYKDSTSVANYATVFQITCLGGYASNAIIGIAKNDQGAGVIGKNISGITSGTGVKGTTNSPGGSGVSGSAENPDGPGWGVKGASNGSEGGGVEGFSWSETGETYGVKGYSKSASGYGVYGSAKKYGVYGISFETQGRAVTGEATETSSIGVRGIAKNTSSTGVWGEGANQGVYGKSESETGTGVFGEVTVNSGGSGNYGIHGRSIDGAGVWGEATTTTGIAFGMIGTIEGINGAGVFGTSNHLTGSASGVWGQSWSPSGYGIRGEGRATSGNAYGIYGESYSVSGYGIYGRSIKYGVFGTSTGNLGRAITGEATGTASIGVRGIATNTSSTGVMGEGANYDFYANGPGVDYGTGSSIRWKKDIYLIPEPIRKIQAIRGVYFDWDDAHGGKHDVGFIAEEVGKILPEIVVYEENGVDAIGLDYSKITPLLLEAIKEQQRQIEELKALVNTLIANQTEQSDN